MESLNGNISIGIIGAGISGIGAAIQIQKQLKLDSFTLFDRNEDVGGTWLKNTYPGCRCDIESHLYSYSFELNPNWSMNFSPQSEILEYLKNLAKKYDIYRRTKFRTDVKRLTWDESSCKWILVYADNQSKDSKEKTMLFDIIINGPGGLSVPNIPREYQAFSGPSMHSAQWDHSIKLKDRCVAVIGGGASAVQIIPSIVDEVKELHVYQRKVPFITPRIQYHFTDFVRFLFRIFPLFLWIWRCLFFWYHETIYDVFVPNTRANKWVSKLVGSYRKKQIPEDKVLRKSLTPNYTLGCNRLLVSDDYYPAMALPHVKLHTDHIEKIAGQTIYTKNGQSQHIDVLIFATGFRVQEYFSPLVMIGVDGIDIYDLWIKNSPQAYYGITSHHTPNQFYLLGPNTALGHGSIIFQIECQINFTMAVIKEMIRRNARRVSVKSSVEAEYMKTMKDNLKKTVWGSKQCGSWYADKAGRITTQWPLNCVQYWKQTKNINFNKFEFS